MNLRQTTIRRFWPVLMSLAILFHAIEAYAQERTAHQPAINVIFLDDGATTLPEGSELRRNNWQEWRKRLPTFLRKLRMVADFRQAEGNKLDPAASLYAVEVSSSLSRERTEEIITSELYRIHDFTKRPSAILARSTAGKDQLRIVFQDSHDYPPAHAAKFLRLLGEISPAIAHRRIAKNFGPFKPPPTIIFDPRTHMLSPDEPQEELPKQRWGVLEDTYLLPQYVLHLLAILNVNVRATTNTFYIHSVPESGIAAGQEFKSDLYVAGAGINTSPSMETTDVVRLARMRSGRDCLVVPLYLSEWKARGLGLDNPRTATEIRTYASMKARQAQVERKDIVFDIRPDLSPYIIDKKLLKGSDVVDYLYKSPRLKDESQLYAKGIDSILDGYKDAGTGGLSHGLFHSVGGYADCLAKKYFNQLEYHKVRVGPDMAIPRIEGTIKRGGFAAIYTGSGDIWSAWNLATKSTAQEVAKRTGGIALHDKTWRGHKIALSLGQFEVYSGKTSSACKVTIDPAKLSHLGLHQRGYSNLGGILFDKGNIYFLDLSGRVRRSGEKAKAAVDASGGIAGTFKEEEKAKLAVSIPVGSVPQKVSGKGVSDLLCFYRDACGMNMGFLPFSLPRFGLPDSADVSKLGGNWTFEPIIVQGIAIKQKGVFSRIRRQITLIPLETGNHLSYSYQSELSNLQERQRKDYVQSSDICYKSQGSNFQPELVSNKDGTFSWALRHGVVIGFDNSGRVTAIRCPTGNSILYTHSEGKLVEKQTSDGRSIKIQYAGQQPEEARINDLISVRYEYDAGGLKSVKGKNHIDEFRYDNTGRLSAIKHDNRTVSLKNDSWGRLTKVTSATVDVTLKYVSNRSTLRISDSNNNTVEWHFGPKDRIAGVTRSDTGILWTRSSEGRIIQMAVGTISPVNGGCEFAPTVLVGTLP